MLIRSGLKEWDFMGTYIYSLLFVVLLNKYTGLKINSKLLGMFELVSNLFQDFVKEFPILHKFGSLPLLHPVHLWIVHHILGFGLLRALERAIFSFVCANQLLYIGMSFHFSYIEIDNILFVYPKRLLLPNFQIYINTPWFIYRCSLFFVGMLSCSLCVSMIVLPWSPRAARMTRRKWSAHLASWCCEVQSHRHSSGHRQ